MKRVFFVTALLEAVESYSHFDSATIQWHSMHPGSAPLTYLCVLVRYRLWRYIRQEYADFFAVFLQDDVLVFFTDDTPDVLPILSLDRLVQRDTLCLRAYIGRECLQCFCARCLERRILKTINALSYTYPNRKCSPHRKKGMVSRHVDSLTHRWREYTGST
jgi:hypothetical protein